MQRQVALLRGINLGSRNRIPMAALRELLGGAGLRDVSTYVQSGNVVLSSDEDPTELELRLETLIAGEFRFEVPVIVRTTQELAAVVKHNPLADVAVDPKRHQVTFLAHPLSPERVEAVAALAAGSERLAARGRELYAWHPDGVARSKLSAKLGSSGLGVKATSRNWTTVTTLLEMAGAR
jgi:uncharacterized protein (DUF1697 family)